jgi:hypothetical protein
VAERGRTWGSQSLGLSEVCDWVVRPSNDGCVYYAAYVQVGRRSGGWGILEIDETIT